MAREKAFSEEDAKMVEAIEVAAEAVGLALYETFSTAMMVKASSTKFAEARRERVAEVWREAATKITDMMMEAD